MDKSHALSVPIRGHKLAFSVEASERLCHVTTPLQTVEVYQTPVFGKVLLLDGHIQLTSFDEKAYHECLVRLPLLNLENPRSALVVGGGDGGAIRELCACQSLERIDMVEIDEDVIRLSRQHLPELSDGAFDDPRVNVTIGDAFDFVRTQHGAYDLIVLDSTDTYEAEGGEISAMLFTREFFSDCRRALKPGGVAVTQADNPVFCPYSLEAIKREVGSCFPKVGSYLGLVPSFGGYSAFCWASEQAEMSLDWSDKWADSAYLNSRTYGLAFANLPFS